MLMVSLFNYGPLSGRSSLSLSPVKTSQDFTPKNAKSASKMFSMRLKRYMMCISFVFQYIKYISSSISIYCMYIYNI
jgi:hypothetical protein